MQDTTILASVEVVDTVRGELARLDDHHLSELCGLAQTISALAHAKVEAAGPEAEEGDCAMVYLGDKLTDLSLELREWCEKVSALCGRRTPPTWPI